MQGNLLSLRLKPSRPKRGLGPFVASDDAFVVTLFLTVLVLLFLVYPFQLRSILFFGKTREERIERVLAVCSAQSSDSSVSSSVLQLAVALRLASKALDATFPQCVLWSGSCVRCGLNKITVEFLAPVDSVLVIERLATRIINIVNKSVNLERELLKTMSLFENNKY